MIFSFVGLIPVLVSAVRSLLARTLSVDLLASIALTFSLLAEEWTSAAFITLMLAFARLFDYVTQSRAKKTIQSLMKYHVERVRILVNDSVKEIPAHDARPGDLVVVEAGDRMPVDGIVFSGEASVDESSLTGESELVSKKKGDKVFTSTFNDSGSLVVRTSHVGADTTLSRMIKLVENSSQNKSRAERAADRFTQWYIFMSLAASIIMYVLGLSTHEILAVLLVVCADDIAVAVPLAFTIATTYAAKRGVVVKGGSVLEQLSKVKFILTDKTGTLTRGKPVIVDFKAYGAYSVDEVVARFATGASESRHAVTKAIKGYAESHHIKAHPPETLEEVPGQGLSFKHDGENMLMGRVSFMEKSGCYIAEELKRDIAAEKEAGRGISCLALNGHVIGLLSYRDELRPRAKEIIGETRNLGVEEWHMLTGDNERAAKLVANELGLTHFHANMTPEGKVEFIRKFEHEHHGTRLHKGMIAFIGDGVNDAASLALADVSIAMGGIGADAAIEAADITIMKDHLSRVPETMKIAKKVISVMRGNFWIWGITNVVGLALVGFGFIGPAGAATYNFLTDFLPIGNALRAGRK